MKPDRVYEATCGAMAELVAHGVRHAVVSPGSRSTPLTIAARWTEDLEVSIHLDERSAGFHALGLARVTGRPVVLICTSGTAAANYLPAVIEAHYTGVPLVVFTADRPHELREVGAGQTIDQVHLYGDHVRHFAEVPVAGEVDPFHLRVATARAVATATGVSPGPVHLNWPFREPLEPVDGRPEVASASVRAVVGAQRPSTSPTSSWLRELGEHHERGVIVAGPTPGWPEGRDRVIAFAEAAGWVVLAEPLSQLREARDCVVETYDQLLRHPWADEHAPEVVVRIGNSPTSKPLRLWLDRVRPKHQILIDPAGRWNDATVIGGPVSRDDIVTAFAEPPPTRAERPWATAWRTADDAAIAAIAGVLGRDELLEPEIARLAHAATPDDGVFMVSNSMPVRDLDLFAVRRENPPLTLGHRGASGIDGLISAASGAARSGRSTVLLIGDVAVIHDIGGLHDAARRDIDLTLVVPNNDGGGIFSFLPIAGHDDVHFDELFHTPHGTALDSVPGVRHRKVNSATTLAEALVETVGTPGVDLIEIPVDRDANLTQHRDVTAAVAAVLTGGDDE